MAHAMKHLAFPLVLLVAGLGLAGSGCSKRSRAEHHLKYADRCYEIGQQDQAEMEYLAVLQNDPQNARALRNLGFIHFRQARYETALQLLSAARSVLPDDQEVRLKYAELLATIQAIPEARAELLLILQRTPDNDTAVILLADLTGTNQITEVRQVMQSCRQQAGDRAGFHVALGTLAAKEGDWVGADREYHLALTNGSVQGPAHLGLANLYLARRDLTNAEAQLQQMAAAEPMDSPRRLRLVDFKLGTGASEEARRLLSEMTSKAPRFVLPWQYLANLAFAEGKYDDCKAALKKVLLRSPLNLEARLLQARMNLLQGRANEAIRDMDALIAAYPRHPGLRYQLGQAYLQLNQIPKALQTFDQALSLDPDHVETILAVAGINLRRGDFAQVVASLSELLKKAPGVLQAHLLLAEAYRLRGTPEEALGVYHSLATNLPRDPRFSLLSGSLLQSMGRTAESRQAFARVLEIAPGNLEALIHLAELDGADGQPQAALRRVQEQSEKYPNSLPHQLLLAELYLDQKQFDSAGAILLKLPQSGPGSEGVAALLARVYARANQHGQALAKLDHALAKDPKDGALLMQKALILTEIKEYEKARDVYEKLLGFNPQNPLVLNNLAYLYSENLGKLDKAAQFARKARELNPLDPSIADTLGWILFKQREYPYALSLLLESQEALSTNPEAQYHLGMAHYMMGEEVLAKNALARALQSPKPFAGREEASRWMEFLQVQPDSADAKTIERLAKRLEEEPGDPVALARLTGIYEQAQQPDRVVVLYERALHRDPTAIVPLLRLAEFYSARLHRPDKALEYAQQARRRAPDDPVVGHLLGQLAFEARDYAAALERFKICAQRQPRQAEVQFDLGRCQYVLGRATEAEECLRRALALGGFPQTNQARRWLEMIEGQRTPTGVPLAKQGLPLALSNEPTCLPALMLQGLIQERQPAPAAALQTYETILKQWPDFLPALRRLAVLYSDKGEDQRALDLSKRARAADPKDVEMTQVAGKLAYRSADYRTAARLFKEVSATRPQDAEVWYYAGLAQARLKANAEAKLALQRALTLDPQHALAAQGRLVLEGMK